MHPASPSARCRAGRCRPGRGCDDSRLVGLKLIFLIVSRTMSLLRLSRRESWWKDAEILMLRHQLSIALREQPRAHSRLTWSDRAWLALLAGTLPIDRLAAMRLIVTPGTVLRWHRDIVRRRWARRSRHGRCGRPPVRRKCAVGGAAAGPGERVMGVPPHSRRTGRARHHGSGVDGMADPEECGDRPGTAPGRAGLAGVLAITGTGDLGTGLLHRRSPQRREDLRPGRNRAWHPPRSGPRCHRAPGPVLGRAAGQGPAHGPGRCRDAGEVRATRQGRQLHAGVRCCVPGRGREGHPLCGPGAANEFDHGTVDRQLPAGAAGPHP
jgi:hypothetical protein